MLDLVTIKKNYPENMQVFERLLLKEYLQCKILSIIFGSEYGNKLCFLGGTAIRLVYDSIRFSEDIDFDNFGLKEEDFEGLIKLIKRKMELEGYEVEFRNVYKGAYRCYLRFPRLLFKMGLSGYEEEKVLIQIDTVKRSYKYDFERYLLNKFDVFTQINIVPKDILLSKKIAAALERKTLKGRDFFDIVFLFSLAEPDYEYLENKCSIKDLTDVKTRLLKVLDGVDMKMLAKDVQPFLFKPEEISRVIMFKEFISSLQPRAK
jgi:predicted nucleotidyltransferase component of viral defense system